MYTLGAHSPPLVVDHRIYILLTSKLADDVKMCQLFNKFKQQLGTIQVWQP